jgi:hypothetical protein
MVEAGYYLKVTAHYFNNLTNETYPEGWVPTQTPFQPNVWVNYTYTLYGPPIWLGYRPRQLYYFITHSNPQGLFKTGCVGCGTTTTQFRVMWRTAAMKGKFIITCYNTDGS